MPPAGLCGAAGRPSRLWYGTRALAGPLIDAAMPYAQGAFCCTASRFAHCCWCCWMRSRALLQRPAAPPWIKADGNDRKYSHRLEKSGMIHAAVTAWQEFRGLAGARHTRSVMIGAGKYKQRKFNKGYMRDRGVKQLLARWVQGNFVSYQPRSWRASGSACPRQQSSAIGCLLMQAQRTDMAS